LNSGERDRGGATADSPEGDVAPCALIQEARSAHPAGHGLSGVTSLREADASAASHGWRKSVTLVPQGAVKTDSGTTFVFLVNGPTVERRAVKIGGTDGDRVEVLAGLKGGDRVVIAPPPELAQANDRREVPGRSGIRTGQDGEL
jgi:hypothetical protein